MADEIRIQRITRGRGKRADAPGQFPRPPANQGACRQADQHEQKSRPVDIRIGIVARCLVKRLERRDPLLVVRLGDLVHLLALVVELQRARSMRQGRQPREKRRVFRVDPIIAVSANRPSAGCMKRLVVGCALGQHRAIAEGREQDQQESAQPQMSASFLARAWVTDREPSPSRSRRSAGLDQCLWEWTKASYCSGSQS